eukprot:TRINITY_DN40331_c0_g1_i1.p1 TRINITY_DN40331_c0_g1~~TRINITY_DN40331_c0_g1_i1.p1  ORF type:complete len:421 (+),score=87.66 TRINITY_DN40331_c0_g1_i1:142-1404(+)
MSWYFQLMLRRLLRVDRLSCFGGAVLGLWFLCYQFIRPDTREAPLASSAESASSGQALAVQSLEKLRAAARASCQPVRAEAKVVLVTGTGGFIGYHAAVALRRRGDGVLGIDNFNSYYPIGLKRARATALSEAGVYTVEGDLNDKWLLEEIFRTCRFTHILHLAAQAGVRYAKKDPLSYVKSNVEGFVNVLEVVKEQPAIPRVVYASSSSVYGTNTKVPFSEDDVVDHPASLYAASKKSDEMIAHTYNHVYGIALTGLRFFTVYGPFGRPDMAAFAFANKIMTGGRVRIFQGPGGVELERDFTYIDDIVDGCVRAVDHIGASVKPAPIKVYNLGNRNPVNVSHFVDLLEEFMGMPALREYVPLPALGDVLKTHANVSRAREELGYEPQTSLREGMRRFVDWYKAFYRNGLDAAMRDYAPM